MVTFQSVYCQYLGSSSICNVYLKTTPYEKGKEWSIENVQSPKQNYMRRAVCLFFYTAANKHACASTSHWIKPHASCNSFKAGTATHRAASFECPEVTPAEKPRANRAGSHYPTGLTLHPQRWFTQWRRQHAILLFTAGSHSPFPCFAPSACTRPLATWIPRNKFEQKLKIVTVSCVSIGGLRVGRDCQCCQKTGTVTATISLLKVRLMLLSSRRIFSAYKTHTHKRK